MAGKEWVRREHGIEEEDIEEGVFLGVLSDAIGLLEENELPYALVGGFASAYWGRPRWTHDIDLFVQPGDAGRAVGILADAGFRTEETDHSWLYKAWKQDVLVDVIFRATGDIYLDQEMIDHVRVGEAHGIKARFVAPEDLIVIKVSVHTEQFPRHWFDALGIIARAELDWDYLVRRAGHSARRVLSLLLYAQSTDLIVPDKAIDELYASIYRS